MGFWGFITTAALVVSLATKIQDAKEMAGLAFSIVTGGGEDAACKLCDKMVNVNGEKVLTYGGHPEHKPLFTGAALPGLRLRTPKELAAYDAKSVIEPRAASAPAETRAPTMSSVATGLQTDREICPKCKNTTNIKAMTNFDLDDAVRRER